MASRPLSGTAFRRNTITCTTHTELHVRICLGEGGAIDTRRYRRFVLSLMDGLYRSDRSCHFKA